MTTKSPQFAKSREVGRSSRLVAPSKLLSTEEVAEQTGLSVETLAQWRSQKKGMPYVKISRNCVRYRQTDLDDWLAERIVRTDKEPPDRR
jgi:excisionase family DNA binding protein